MGVGCLALLDAIFIYLVGLLKGVDWQCLDIHDAHHASLGVFPQVKFGLALVRLFCFRGKQVVQLVEVKLDHVAFKHHSIR